MRILLAEDAVEHGRIFPNFSKGKSKKMAYTQNTVDKLIIKMPKRIVSKKYLTELLKQVKLFFGNESEGTKTYDIKVNNDYWDKLLQNIRRLKIGFQQNPTKTTIKIKINDKFQLSFKKSGLSSVSEKTSSVSGKVVEVLSESFFCVYNALRVKMSIQEWKKFSQEAVTWKDMSSFKSWTSKKGIRENLSEQFKDPEFSTYFKQHKNFLSSWHPRLIAQANLFYDNYLKKAANKNSLIYVRADALPKKIDPYACFNIFSDEVKSRMKFSSKIDKDKWNPADVWIYNPSIQAKMNSMFGSNAISNFKKQVTQSKSKNVSRSVNILDPKILNKINQSIYDLYEQKKLFPVSLKAPNGTNVRTSLMNYSDPKIKKSFKMNGVTFTNSNQDVKLHFEMTYSKKGQSSEKIEGYLKSKTDTGGFRLELEFRGAGARMGTLGTENWQYIIFNTDRSGVNKLDKIRKKHAFSTKDFKTSGYKWFGGLEYKKFNRSEMQNLKPYLDDLYKHLNGSINDSTFKGKDGKFIMNKTAAGEIGIAIDKITGTANKTSAVKHIFDFASSQGFGFGSKKITKIFESCFHIKVW